MQSIHVFKMIQDDSPNKNSVQYSLIAIHDSIDYAKTRYHILPLLYEWIVQTLGLP